MLKILQVIDIYCLIIEIPYKRAYVIPTKEGICRLFLSRANNNVISTEGEEIYCYLLHKNQNRLKDFVFLQPKSINSRTTLRSRRKRSHRSQRGEVY